jgi:DNA-binding transcriptional LysR family regulator
MQDLNDLYYFASVAERGGFAAASRALQVPKSKLSRRVAQLESRLGVRLLQRSTRRFAVTDLGQAYLAHCKAMLVEADAAQTVVDAARSEPCGRVRLSCPIALLHALVGRMLIEFAQRFPAVSVELVGVNRPVDLLAEGVDLALRVRRPPLADSDLALRMLGRSTQCLVASPQLLAARGPVQSPGELANWPSLGHGVPGATQGWYLLGPEGAEATMHPAPRFLCSDMLTLRDAAIAGLGVAQLPLLLIREAIDRGQLVRLLPDWAPQPETIHAVFPSRRGLMPAVRGLLDHLAQSFESLGPAHGVIAR